MAEMIARIVDSSDEIRDAVRERYANAAQRVTDPTAGGDGCCGSASDGDCCSASVLRDEEGEAFGAALYAAGDRDELPSTATSASLGCGNPTAVAELHEGETVLDLGSGGGIDVLLSAKRVGPTGFVYGLDMTDEMLTLARANQRKAGMENVQWLRGHIEQIPLEADSVDVVISNCVINLSADKRQALREAARVLRPGGRFAVSDVIADEDMAASTRADMQAFTGCIAGALTRAEFEHALTAAGLIDVEIRETHRVHEHAGSAIIRARKPDGGCCDTGVADGELPGACTLAPDDAPARMRRWQALSTKGRPSARRSGHRLEVRYQPESGVREELDALAAAERQCCSFVAWEVRQDGCHPVLHVTADPSAPDDLAPIAALFGAD